MRPRDAWSSSACRRTSSSDAWSAESSLALCTATPNWRASSTTVRSSSEVKASAPTGRSTSSRPSNSPAWAIGAARTTESSRTHQQLREPHLHPAVADQPRLHDRSGFSPPIGTASRSTGGCRSTAGARRRQGSRAPPCARPRPPVTLRLLGVPIRPTGSRGMREPNERARSAEPTVLPYTARRAARVTRGSKISASTTASTIATTAGTTNGRSHRRRGPVRR